MRRSPLAWIALDRYAASTANSVLGADPHSGPRRAERAKQTQSTSQGRGSTRIGISRASPWLVLVLGSVSIETQDSFRLQAEIPGVIEEGAPLQVFVGGFQGLEGPVGAPDGSLYFSDIPANRTYRIDSNGMMSVWRENTNGANGLFVAKDGRLLAAEGGGRRIVAVTPDGRVTALATEFNGQPLRAPNDLIADSKGGIYFTDPGPRPASHLAPK